LINRNTKEPHHRKEAYKREMSKAEVSLLVTKRVKVRAKDLAYD